MRTRVRGLAVAAGMFLTASIGILPWALPGASASAPAATTAAAQAVSIVNIAYSPTTVTIAAGTPVTWTNNETSATSHSATSDTGAFDSSPSCPSSGCLMPGQSFSFTFATAGTYAYHCRVHSSMHGTIVVTAATTPTPTSTATPTPSASATPSPTPTPVPTASTPESTASPTPSLTAPAPTSPTSPPPGTQVLGSSTSRPALPVTGAGDTALLLAAAAVLLVAGASLALVARRAAGRSES